MFRVRAIYFLFSMKYYIHLLLFLVTAHFSLSAQWVQTNGPGGGLILDMAQIGDKAWVGTPTGLYTSTPDLTWELSDLVPQSYWVKDFYQNGADNLILCVKNDGSDYKVLHSTDQGNNWTTYNFSCPFIYCYDVSTQLWIVKVNDRIYIYSAAQAYYLENFTEPWTKVTLPGNILILSIAIDTSSIIACANNGMELYKSTDGGVTWSSNAFFNGTPFYLEDSLIISRISSNKIVVSQDWGNTWTTITNSALDVNLIRRSEDGKLYGGMADSVSYSLDNGITWVRKHIGGPYYSSGNLRATLINDDFTLVGTRQGIRKADSWNDDFTANNQGLVASFIKRITSNGKDKLYALTPFEIFYSYNKGASWSKLDIPVNQAPLFFNLMSKGDTAFINAHYSVNGKPAIARSIDNGVTWYFIDLPGTEPVVSFVHRPYTEALVWSENALFVVFRNNNNFSYAMSTDWGTTWKPFIYVNNQISGQVRDFVYLNNKIYAFEQSGIVRYSEDQGDTWTQIFNLQIQLDKVYKFGNRFYITSVFDNLLYSDDNFSTINFIKANGLPLDYDSTYSPIVVMTHIGDTLFGITRNKREILFSLDQGQNWAPYHNGLDVSWVFPSDMCTLNNQLFTGTQYAGVWRYDNIVSSIDEATAEASNLSLNISPNPATDRTSVQLPAEWATGQDVRLNLYNADGQLLFYQQITTSAQLDLTLPELESGMYILEAVTGKGRATGRLIKQ